MDKFFQFQKSSFVSYKKIQRRDLPLRYHSYSGFPGTHWAIYRSPIGTAYRSGKKFGVRLGGDISQVLPAALHLSGSSL